MTIAILISCIKKASKSEEKIVKQGVWIFICGAQRQDKFLGGKKCISHLQEKNFILVHACYEQPTVQLCYILQDYCLKSNKRARFSYFTLLAHTMCNQDSKLLKTNCH